MAPFLASSFKARPGRDRRVWAARSWYRPSPRPHRRGGPAVSPLPRLAGDQPQLPAAERMVTITSSALGAHGNHTVFGAVSSGPSAASARVRRVLDRPPASGRRRDGGPQEPAGIVDAMLSCSVRSRVTSGLGRTAARAVVAASTPPSVLEQPQVSVQMPLEMGLTCSGSWRYLQPSVQSLIQCCLFEVRPTRSRAHPASPPTPKGPISQLVEPARGNEQPVKAHPQHRPKAHERAP